MSPPDQQSPSDNDTELIVINAYGAITVWVDGMAECFDIDINMLKEDSHRVPGVSTWNGRICTKILWGSGRSPFLTV